MATRKSTRSTAAGEAALRLGEEDGWGTGAARRWSSAAAVEAAADAAAAPAPPAAPLDDADEIFDHADDVAAAAAAAAAPLVNGTRLKVWWRTKQQWFAGAICEMKLQDGSPIHKVVYNDGDKRWYNLADPQHHGDHSQSYFF